MKRDLPSLRLLQAFATVVGAGSVQSAAAELNVTQPAVSQALKHLEGHCGFRLLDRSRRPAQPTEAGRELAAVITDGLDRVERTIDALRLAELQSGPSVTVACSVGVATYWLMPALASFYEAHPDLTVNVSTTQAGAPELSEGVDLAIRFGHGRWRDGVVTRLFDEVVEPVCAPTLRNQFDAAVPLDQASLLHVRSSEISWITWPDYLGRVGGPVIASRGQVFTNYVQVTQAALESRGVMLGWRSITGALVAEGRLVPAGWPPFSPSNAFYVTARSKRSGPGADALGAWLLARAGRMPPC